MAAIGLSVMGAFVLKSLMVAKIAAFMSTVLLISKLFHKQEESAHVPKHIEVEPPTELHSDFSELSPSGSEYYYPTGSDAYYSYASLPQGIDYATPEHAAGNSTLPAVPGNQQVARRRDPTKRRKVPVITIHQYSVKT
ncbi:hypothetical protein Zmor_025730 [Zophobas morio]|uniref:Uncharacterized protein n=1 Tax=Zophobas morio TaxID=2755281 RepID=A0AA38HUQ5_9CUCU|nr:hypothetical protein Zmor_025730 [Zophobas morio]